MRRQIKESECAKWGLVANAMGFHPYFSEIYVKEFVVSRAKKGAQSDSVKASQTNLDQIQGGASGFPLYNVIFQSG